MRNKIFSIMAGVLVIAGCAKETAPSNDAGHSDYLVIKAECADLTKTDMNLGQSVWEEGDVITVVYDGAAYEYVAQTAGLTTTFTSNAGISNYDASKSIVAYYPATTSEGIVKIEEERTVVFSGEGQITKSCAPLVGNPQEGNLTGGVLNMSFENIFSVLELRIDGGTLAGTAKSLTLMPVDENDFEGYISVTGKVDPTTLAVTSSSTSKQMKIILPDNADPKTDMTIKVPVGRFSTDSGLKVVLETTEGTYPKVIYKSGVSSYEEKNGSFKALHLAKPMYAFAPVGGGIKTAADLVAFAAAVNAGENLAPWTNESGKIVLLNDIDMASVESWTPIGASVLSFGSDKLALTSGKMFTGYFDGQGYSIKNLKMVCNNSTANTAWGFFGCLGPGAIVENLVFDSSCSLTLNPSAYTDCGMLAGIVWDARVIDVINNAPMNFTATSGLDNKRITMGVVGMGFAQNDSTVLKRVVNRGAVTAASGGSTKANANGIHISGILASATNYSGSSKIVAVIDCDNFGDIESATGRVAGIVTAANKYTHIRGCDNFGDQLNTFATNGGARLGNITCLTGDGCAIYDTRNFGDIICTTAGAAGGILCLVNNDNNIFEGVETYGDIVSDKDYSYKGFFFGQNTKTNAKFKDCVVGGRIGKYNGGTYQFEEATADNFWNFMGKTKDANHIAAMKPYFTFTTEIPSVQ